MSSRKFTAEEIRFLKENSSSMTPQELATKLGRAYSSVNQKLRDLNLERKRKEIITRGWDGCEKTCPEFCPYKDCRMPTELAAIGIEKDFMLKELLWQENR